MNINFKNKKNLKIIARVIAALMVILCALAIHCRTAMADTGEVTVSAKSSGISGSILVKISDIPKGIDKGKVYVEIESPSGEYCVTCVTDSKNYDKAYKLWEAARITDEHARPAGRE